MRANDCQSWCGKPMRAAILLLVGLVLVACERPGNKQIPQPGPPRPQTVHVTSREDFKKAILLYSAPSTTRQPMRLPTIQRAVFT